jgi:hypothetical protein
MMRIAVLGLAGLALAGCGIAAEVGSRNEYQASAERYKACLAANSTTPQNCESLRLTMETDERKFQNISAGRSHGATSGTYTILNR